MALLLAGCVSMSGIDPRATSLEANQLEAGKTIATAANTAWPQQDWWRAYGDSQLDALVDRTVAGSPTLHVAQARVMEDRAACACGWG